MTTAATLLMLLGAYLTIGVPFALAFAWRGAGVIDPVAVHAGWGFRVVILPGSAALWPMLLGKWVSAARKREPSA